MFRNLKNINYAILSVKHVHPLYQISRSIWGYVSIAFNRVDVDRLKLVGADRLCAEWLLKNGGAIRMTENSNLLWQDYNALPPENRKFQIKVADATNSSIMKIGLAHFSGCSHIDTVILKNCKYLEEGSLEGLIHLKKSLVNLEISDCDDLRDYDIKMIGNLKKLNKLVIGKLISVTDFEKSLRELQSSLPKCEIEIK